ncbi:MAG: RidA family protein [Candidatus Eisenbacteria bacterium]|uniref:RidA family protein n=1 Tax=Eiseniibacteriota bacterium TaxID=2212470 RepID=A0A933SFW7_UNCEI|nr:RidA family protein [Candidatus Eisenbacteria bacterium]
MPISRLAPGPRLSGVVIHGDTVYLAGHVVADRSLGVKGQTEAILKRIDERLAEAGTDKTRLLSVTIYLADIATFDEMNEAWDAWVDRAAAPARATVGAALASPEYLVEISAIAAR